MPPDVSLSNTPNEWTDVECFFAGRFRQRWMPGAFGDRTNLEGITHYSVIREEWNDSGEVPERTILEGVALDYPRLTAQARSGGSGA